MGYNFFTDICCDLPLSYIEQHDLNVMPFPTTIEGREYQITADPSDPGAIDAHTFYDKLRAGIPARTAQLSYDLCKREFEAVLAGGQDVFYLAFTSGLSGSCSVGCLVRDELMEQYPGRKVVVVDSLCASLGQGLLVHMALKKMREGFDIDQLAEFCEANRRRVHHWVVVDDLMHLRRGGRASGPVALLGTILGIKPILIVNEEGKLPAIDKIQGRRRALKHLVDKMDEEAVKPIAESVFISHGDCLADAQLVQQMVKERFGVEVEIINHISPIIGCHAGPGTVALFFLSDAPRG